MKTILPESIRRISHIYCPGCGHGIIHRLMGEAIDELGIVEKTIAIAPVGCAVFGYFYWHFDTTEAAHGRPPAVATGIKRVLPDRIVITYQGDGDLAAIGGNEMLHAANRGENITVLFVNNACYGMTGGQMAPTTLLKQVTTTTPKGRTNEDGYPLRVCELLSTLGGVAYAERVAVNTPANIMKARAAVKKALQYQIDKKGFTIVEFLSMCPVGWGLAPVESAEWINKEMIKYFPLGVFKDTK
ncbi:MAG: thiamine pyrophosphate-dependent enzyme [Candidatus Omnitrophica bacterium]|nr:thiamine pyrophosphate-dependent enzyme [Candidatus Omnitrophota bacterium]